VQLNARTKVATRGGDAVIAGGGAGRKGKRPVTLREQNGTEGASPLDKGGEVSNSEQLEGRTGETRGLKQ